jgi:hypothetical protein
MLVPLTAELLFTSGLMLSDVTVAVALDTPAVMAIALIVTITVFEAGILPRSHDTAPAPANEQEPEVVDTPVIWMSESD